MISDELDISAELAATHTAAPRILTIDIERLPGLAPIFDQRTSGFIPVYKWQRLPSLLCFAAKWHDRKAVEFYAAWDDPDIMVQRAWDLYHEADIIVGYNQTRFDNKHLKSEWAVAGMSPPSPWKDVDLFVTNKSTFGFESKSLQHLCERLGLDTKSGHYSAEMAEACINGDEKAQRIMKRYNRGDVRITEQAYDRLLPWITNHPHVGMWTHEPESCGKCGGTSFTRDGSAKALLGSYPQYQCDNCGGWSRDNQRMHPVTMRGIA